MNHSEIFYGELQLIQDKTLAADVQRILNKLVPPYFYILAASSTGKYHPWYSLGYGGLVRHTKAAVRIAYDLLQIEQYKHLNSDAIIAALILHDTFKHGIDCGPYTVANHPLVAAHEIITWVEKNLPEEQWPKFREICDLIASHMGQWNMVNNQPLLPKPKTEAEKFVHLCDYLASRKYIVVEVQ